MKVEFIQSFSGPTMNRGPATVSSTPSIISLSHSHHLRTFKSFKSSKSLTFTRFRLCCTKSNPWEPSPVLYAPNHIDETAADSFLNNPSNVFQSLSSEVPEEETKELKEVNNQSQQQVQLQLQFLKWPMWLLGPSLLLTTGMAPTLWLPISSVFLGANIASLLSLIGLDCIYNLGATLFLLMADACARPKQQHPIKALISDSEAPFSYQFWNMFANLSGFVIPLMMLYGSQKGFLQPHLPFISFSILVAPYMLLLSVQILTELLTWHWQSPVWLITPIVYEAYRVLQLMRGLKLAVEINAPTWMMHTIRGLVSWWVLILGIQLMRVAWFAGLASRSSSRKQQFVSDDL